MTNESCSSSRLMDQGLMLDRVEDGFTQQIVYR